MKGSASPESTPERALVERVDRMIREWAGLRKVGEQVHPEFVELIAAFAAEYAKELQDEVERLRAQIRMSPGPHVHSFTWASGNAAPFSEPPLDCRCVCGLSYRCHKEMKA